MSQIKMQIKPSRRDYVRTALTLGVSFLLVIGMVLAGLYFQDKERYREVIFHELLKFGCISALIGLMFFLLFMYLKYAASMVLTSPKKLTMFSTILVSTVALNLLFGIVFDVHIRPYALICMLMTILMNRKIGLFAGICSCFIMFFYDMMVVGFVFTEGWQFASVVSGITGCSLASIFVGTNARRFKVVLYGFRIGIPVALAVFVTQTVFGTYWIGNVQMAIIAGGSAFLAAMLYLAILPVFEKLFNVITIYRLNELTDHNRTLIKRLMREAPGTFNHVLTVSNLAEACALAIGEDPHLVKAASYYHDIGKLVNPEYFKENQSTYNPHDQLTPELSTSFIKKHTEDGYALAKEYHLPDEIADVTLQHHGTMPIKYFYYKALKFTDGELSMENFCYNGPKPRSRAAAIIMICDASEAAIRTLSDHSRKKVEEMVRSIIEERMELDQFIECDITMREIYQIRDTIVSSYVGIYHDRIAYPKFKISKKNMEKQEDEKDVHQL